MDGVGEVHWARPLGQFQNVAARREDVHVVGKEVAFEALDELLRIAGALLHLHEVAHPPVGALPPRGVLLGPLVQPMTGDAVVRHLGHVLGADLHFDRRAVGTEQGGVQGLVAIGLGDGDVVLEAARNRFVEAVRHAQCPVARIFVVHHDPQAEHVHDLAERLALAFHLVVDRVQVLLAATHLGRHALRLESGLQRLAGFLDQRPPPPSGLRHRSFDAVGAQGMQRRKTQILKLRADAGHAQPIGDRRVVVKGFPGDAPPPIHRQRPDGAHVVQAVGDLDQHHPDVPGHRQHHLLHVRGLRLGVAAEHGGQLGDPVHQFRHRLAKALPQGRLRHRRVLDHVVQEGRHQRLVVHAHLRQNGGHRQGMGNVGMPGQPPLAGMGLVGVGIGSVNCVDFRGGQIVTQRVAQPGKRAGRSHLVAPGPSG